MYGLQAVENSADQDCDSSTTVWGNLLQYASLIDYNKEGKVYSSI